MRSMPGRRSKHETIREKILESAGRLFNRHGFNAVSIDDVMADAGLTRGSFYNYFQSKTDLYAQSVARVVCAKRDASNGHGAAQFSPDQIVRDYLSVRHFEDVEASCPMIGLPSDISRTDRSVRRAFESALRLMVETFEQGAGGEAKPDRTGALAIAALCVGGMVLARSIEDRGLADEMRDAALAVALSLGNWT
jgi:TetR/AcrR family transcriptional regulator, transcriptional repressor for nem operon